MGDVGDQGGSARAARPHSRAAVAGFGALGAGVNLVQLLSLDVWLRFGVGAVALLSAACALLLHRRTSRDLRARYLSASHCLRLLARARPPESAADVESRFRFEPARAKAKFEEVCSESGRIYGEQNVDPHLTIKWWTRYPHAVFAAYSRAPRDLNALVAWVTIWPLIDAAYAQLRDGNLRERDLCADSIRDSESDGGAYWYVANIAALETYRRHPPMLAELLLRGIKHWLERGKPAEQVHFLAIAMSQEGRGMLRRLDFRPLGRKTLDDFDLYELEIGRDALDAALRATLASPSS
jgi:hypothetical protein